VKYEVSSGKQLWHVGVAEMGTKEIDSRFGFARLVMAGSDRINLVGTAAFTARLVEIVRASEAVTIW